MKRLLLLTIPFIFAAALFALTQTTLHARSGGYTGRTQLGCISCHTGGTAPQVALSGARSVEPNSTTTYQLLITSTSPLTQTHAGFGLTVLDGNGEQAGTLQTSDPDAQISDNFTDGFVAGELTHSQPKPNVGDVAVVEFQWTAPITQGTYTVYFVGNSVNLNGSSSGDMWAADSAEIEVELRLSVGMRAGQSSTNTTPAPLITLVATLSTLSCLLIIKRKRQSKL